MDQLPIGEMPFVLAPPSLVPESVFSGVKFREFCDRDVGVFEQVHLTDFYALEEKVALVAFTVAGESVLVQRIGGSSWREVIHLRVEAGHILEDFGFDDRARVTISPDV